MRNLILTGFVLFISCLLKAQAPSEKLTVEKIMRDPAWIGSSPSSPRWSIDGKTVYFNWNPDNAPADSLYSVTLINKTPVKVTVTEKQNLLVDGAVTYNLNRTAYTYSKDGDIYYTDNKIGRTTRITQTVIQENNPVFSFGQSRIVYNSNENLYAWNIATGETTQLTNLRTGSFSASPSGTNTRSGRNRRDTGNQEEDWLEKDQLQYFEVLRSRKEKREAAEAYNKSLPQKNELRSINIGNKILQGLLISPDGRFVSYRLFSPGSNARSTIVPDYVTESGFTTDIPSRPKVGSQQRETELFIYDRISDTVIEIKVDSIPGIKDLPDYLKDYPADFAERKKKDENRPVIMLNPVWSPAGAHAIIEIHSIDQKDRWLMLWDTSSKKISLLDRQRDEAWIGGPGIFGRTGWIDASTCWFQSEVTGYSHLYTINVISGEKKALTSGNYEVETASLSLDKKYFYISTNEVHPGEQQIYRLTISNKKQERITTMTGANNITLSPDEKYMAILYSYSNKPWELYLQENKPGGKIEQITDKAESNEFRSYAWKDPEIISFTATDGATVYARLYKPNTPHPGKPAVLFVHGAGYLQNAHKWWSSYFREYMFNNLLADNGYYVLDIDYRGSAGYGRDWRTAIYRHMGGKDLSDQVDGVNWLVKNYGVNPKHIGIYGGSYGGFITLMALFTEPDVFAAGAALRSVTNWANYNHGYTSDILNEPYNDSLAYRRSSPLYFAEGLKGHLLMCHGMVDVNVHFQDIVELTQRLIELGKDNWELAVYPMEGHGFTEPSSWTDEYKRVFKLFEEVLKE